MSQSESFWIYMRGSGAHVGDHLRLSLELVTHFGPIREARAPLWGLSEGVRSPLWGYLGGSEAQIRAFWAHTRGFGGPYLGLLCFSRVLGAPIRVFWDYPGDSEAQIGSFRPIQWVWGLFGPIHGDLRPILGSFGPIHGFRIHGLF